MYSSYCIPHMTLISSDFCAPVGIYFDIRTLSYSTGFFYTANVLNMRSLLVCQKHKDLLISPNPNATLTTLSILCFLRLLPQDALVSHPESTCGPCAYQVARPHFDVNFNSVITLHPNEPPMAAEAL